MYQLTKDFQQNIFLGELNLEEFTNLFRKVSVVKIQSHSTFP